MQTRGSTNKSPITNYATENKKYDDLFTNGENLTAKTPPGDFQVITPKTPLLSKQTVTRDRKSVV